MAVALAQPHRRGRRYDPLDGTALGRFVRTAHSDRDLQQSRFAAGKAYAEIIDYDLLKRNRRPYH